MISLDPAKMKARDVYRLLIETIVPRPIAFVSTISPEGLGNLAPFSFFNGVSSNPPAVMFAVTRKRDGGKKDTLLNIEATGQFVVNSVNEWMVEAANQCSAEYPYGVDEMQAVGLTPLPSEHVRPARVKESAVQYECELLHSLEVGDGTAGSSTIVVGRVVRFHIRDEAFVDGHALIEKLRPVSRLGGTSYGMTSGIFSIERPKAP